MIVPAAIVAAGVLAGAWLAGPLGPSIPAVEISYLGRPGTHAERPDGIDGLVAVPAAEADAVVFTGGFDLGATRALRDALAAAPRARLVAFNSPGGRPLAAEGVAEVIRSHHLDTTVTRYCASACTIAYAAGTTRTAAPDAVFAFHLGTGIVLADMAATVVVQMERKWFLRGGVSLNFAERALHAPNPTPYLAPLDELVAAGYVHRAVPAAIAPGPLDPMLSAVAAIEPQTAGTLQWGLTRREKAGMTHARSQAIADGRAGLVADRWLRHSSDTAVLALVDATVTALAALNAHDAQACMQWQIGLEDQDRAASRLPPGLLDAVRRAQRQVLLDANAFPAPTPHDGDGSLAAADAAARAAVAAEFGEYALAQAASREHGFDDPARSCSASIAYLRALRARPDAARLLRWALAAG